MNFERGQFIQSGQYGKIYQLKGDPSKVVKRVKKDIAQPFNEIEILSELKSDFVVKIFNWTEDSKYVYHTIEYMDGGDLFDKIMSNTVTEKLAYDYLKQISLAVRFIHNHQIMHRDIKPENILLTKTGKIKLTDFAFSVPFLPDQKFNLIIGTIPYMAPEMLSSSGYDYKIDIWAIGIVFYEMIFQDSPFIDVTEEDVIHKIRKESVKFPKDISDKSVGIIYELLDKNPKQRISLAELLSMI